MRTDRRGAPAVGVVVRVAGAAVAICMATAAPASAQTLGLKRTFPSATAGICPRYAPAAPATPARVQEARRLFSLGQEASIVGDHRAARDLFRQAETLDASDERLAYYLARSNEELKLTAEAVAQYCRYLAIAPGGTDAADVRSRLGKLTETPATRASGDRRATAAARFQSAVQAADRGQHADAEKGFSAAIDALPDAAEAYFDRGVVRARRKDWPGAARDLERYLSLRPSAEDAADVRERVAVLHRASISPTAALVGGLVIPGFGQYYTRRPVLGALVSAAAIGGVVYALRETERTKDTTYTDSFGNPYPGTLTYRGRYGQSTGLAIAGSALVIGALEGYLHASGQRRDALHLVAVGSGTGTGGRLAATVAPRWVVRADGGLERRVAVGGRLTF